MTTNNCNGCNSSLCITKLDIASKYPIISLLPGSKHIFGKNDEFYHLDYKCIKNKDIPEDVVKIIKNVPAKSLTEFSKLEKKKEISLNCAICLENENKWLIMMPCMHILCSECYNIWETKSNKCPTCNTVNYGLEKSFDEINKLPQYDELFHTKTNYTQPTKRFKKDNKNELNRCISSCITQESLSQPFNFEENIVKSDEYENLRAMALNAHQFNPNPDVKINPTSIAKKIEDLENLIIGTGKIFITSLTEKYISYNDCVIYRFSLVDGKYLTKEFINYNNKSNENGIIQHSGDTFGIDDNLPEDSSILKHGILITPTAGTKTEIQFTNENIIDSEITSKRNCENLHLAFFNQLEKITNSLKKKKKKPDDIIICAQATYDKDNTLKKLSPNMAPSCGVIINRNIYSCDWTDKTNMTCWANLFIYKN